MEINKKTTMVVYSKSVGKVGWQLGTVAIHCNFKVKH